MVNKYYQKTKKRFKKKYVKDITIYLKKTKTKSANYVWEWYQNFTEEKKEKKASVFRPSVFIKLPAISFIIFWDFPMFYQIFLLPQVKRWATITYKHGVYELSQSCQTT